MLISICLIPVRFAQPYVHSSQTDRSM